MIEYLDIINFMPFQELHIDKLKRVNLIAGKNNVGKTALLDAVKVVLMEKVIKQSGQRIFLQILKNRNLFNKENKYSGDLYDSLIHRKSLLTRGELRINSLLLRKGDPYFEGKIDPPFTIEESKRWYKYEVASTLGDWEANFLLENKYSLTSYFDEFIEVSFSSSPDFHTISRLWSPLVLTPREDDVLAILREAIEPHLVRFAIDQSTIKVRLKDTEKPVPLETLGDGVRRILLIALGLANAQGKALLIDEIELGLHYSVMEKMWEIIFKYAVAWDIQVFATTHSQDAIRTFHYVASQEKYTDKAEFIRLQMGRTGKHEAIIYDGDRLKDSLNLELEIR